MQLFDAIMAPDPPIPPTFINIRSHDASTVMAVPATSKNDFEPRSGFDLPVAKDNKQFEKYRADFQRKVNQQAVLIHQRAFGITDAKSVKPWLSTEQVAPCIALMIYDRDNFIGILAHFDANMETRSVATIIDEFPSKPELELSFFGGKEDKSKMTCIGLFQALYDLEKDSKKTRLFSVQRFDVISRPHSSRVETAIYSATARATRCHSWRRRRPGTLAARSARLPTPPRPGHLAAGSPGSSGR